MITNPVLLLVDDDADIREQMKWALMSDYTVVEAEDRRSAVAAVKREALPLVVLDLGLPPAVDASTEGFAILREILQLNPSTKVIVVTGNTDQANALAAIAGGAYDFLEKPVQLDLLKTVLQRAWRPMLLPDRPCIRPHPVLCSHPMTAWPFHRLGRSRMMLTLS